MNNTDTQSQEVTLTDRDILSDALSTQKFTTGKFNTFANECAAQELRHDVMDILNEEHEIQYDIFSEMQKRGWYPTPEAEQQKIMQAKQKFQNMQG